MHNLGPSNRPQQRGPPLTTWFTYIPLQFQQPAAYLIIESFDSITLPEITPLPNCKSRA
jgi:hypothetical protein